MFKSGILSAGFGVSWKDQGWGNRKGKVLVSTSGTTTRVNLFGIADHSWTRRKVTCIDASNLLSKSSKGDEVQFFVHIGDGGGHKLSIKHLNMAIIDRF